MNNFVRFIQANSPDGGFLQSDWWRNFQEKVGRPTFLVEQEGLRANIIEHSLPIVGKYFYIPKGPIIQISNLKSQISNFISEFVLLAKKNNAGWVRIEPENEEKLNLITENINYKIVKAPHDMQPKEIFLIDITKPEEQLLQAMKPKTRYNIRLAEKKGVQIRMMHRESGIRNEFFEDFLRLVGVTAKRNKITSHPENYYRQMWETLPAENLKLCVAEYQNPASTREESTRGGKVIAANLMIFFGKTVTYLHGASDNQYREVMAPYLLQWRAIQEAKQSGYERYDFGGIRTNQQITNYKLQKNNWEGITRFKTGFSSATNPILFPGSFDVIINPAKYRLYRSIQKVKSLIK